MIHLFKIGERLDVEWRINNELCWLRAEVVHVSKCRCTLRYAAHPPFEETHLIVDDCIVEKGTYGVFPFRRLAQVATTDSDSDDSMSDDDVIQAQPRQPLSGSRVRMMHPSTY